MGGTGKIPKGMFFIQPLLPELQYLRLEHEHTPTLDLSITDSLRVKCLEEKHTVSRKKCFGYLMTIKEAAWWVLTSFIES